MVGLMMFMEGLKLGLMPFGEVIGNTLPRKLPLTGVLIIAFLLGIGVTFAEPAIGALQVAGSLVDPVQAPYLFTLLNDRSGTTVLLVGLGVVLQILFPDALAFINADVAGNLIDLINQFSGAGLIGVIAALIVVNQLK